MPKFILLLIVGFALYHIYVFFKDDGDSNDKKSEKPKSFSRSSPPNRNESTHRPAPVYKPDLDSYCRLFAGAVSRVRNCSSYSDQFQYAYIEVTKHGAYDYSVFGVYDHCSNVGVREGLSSGYTPSYGFSAVDDGFVLRQNNVEGREASFSHANIKAAFSARNMDAYCESATFEDNGKSIHVRFKFRV